MDNISLARGPTFDQSRSSRHKNASPAATKLLPDGRATGDRQTTPDAIAMLVPVVIRLMLRREEVSIGRVVGVVAG